MSGKRRKAAVNGKNKRTKITEPSKESFLKDINKLKLFTVDDRYYNTARTSVGSLELEWS